MVAAVAAAVFIFPVEHTERTDVLLHGPIAVMHGLPRRVAHDRRVEIRIAGCFLVIIGLRRCFEIADCFVLQLAARKGLARRIILEFVLGGVVGIKRASVRIRAAVQIIALVGRTAGMRKAVGLCIAGSCQRRGAVAAANHAAGVIRRKARDPHGAVSRAAHLNAAKRVGIRNRGVIHARKAARIGVGVRICKANGRAVRSAVADGAVVAADKAAERSRAGAVTVILHGIAGDRAV